MGGEKPGVDQIRLRADAGDPPGCHRNIGGDVLLASGGARSRLAQKSFRAVHAYGLLRSCYARKKSGGETGAASQVKRQLWTVSHGFEDKGLTGRIEDIRDNP